MDLEKTYAFSLSIILLRIIQEMSQADEHITSKSVTNKVMTDLELSTLNKHQKSRLRIRISLRLSSLHHKGMLTRERRITDKNTLEYTYKPTTYV
jgi:predicted transcriptional regulator